MFRSKAYSTLLWRGVLTSENVTSAAIISSFKNSSKTRELYVVQKRYSSKKKICPEDKKPCEDEPKKSRKLVKLATVAVLGTTVAVLAAKYDDDFRDWSKDHFPALDGLVKVVFQEEETYLESLDRAHKNISAWIKKALHDLFKGTQKSKPGISTKSSSDLPTLDSCDESKTTYKPPESAFLVKGEEDKKDSSAKTAQIPKELKELKDLEDKLGKIAQETIHSLVIAECTLRDFAKLVDYLDQIIITNNLRAWDKMKKLVTEAKKEMEKGKASLVNFKALEQQLTSKLKDDSSLSDDVKAKALNNLNTLSKDVNNAKAKLSKTKGNTLAKRAWDKVKQARLYFSEELETLFPNVWLNDEKLNIPADQMDPFTDNVLAEFDYYMRHLPKYQTILDAEICTALDKYKTKGSEAITDLVDILLPYEVDKAKKKLQMDLQKDMLAHKAKCEKNTKELLKQTKALYADLTAEALKLKEKEVERKMQQQLEEKLAQLRAQHKLEIAKMVGRMEGANEAISKRGEKDVKQQNNQQFWSAAQSFMAAVKPLGTSAQAQEPKPLKNEINNLNKVKPEKDELVDSVLESIPPEAAEKGVPSEASLRERFIKVMRCARGWAGVPEGEITLLQLFLARVQSALYINVAIPQDELNNEPAIDLEQLNNYDILFRAKYYVDRGEFDQAIRYLNLLKGPSSKVASDWVKDALVYLETRQAAELLLAHATAASMQG